MTSKEFIQNEINSLKDMLENARKRNLRTIIKACEEDIEQYNQVLKDLEEYEELKKLMGTPIQDIMKRLEILDILKPRIYIEEGLYREDFQDDRLKFDKDFFDSAEQENTIKEWLEDDK